MTPGVTATSVLTSVKCQRHRSSVWPWSGAPKLRMYGTIISGLQHRNRNTNSNMQPSICPTPKSCLVLWWSPQPSLTKGHWCLLALSPPPAGCTIFTILAYLPHHHQLCFASQTNDTAFLAPHLPLWRHICFLVPHMPLWHPHMPFWCPICLYGTHTCLFSAPYAFLAPTFVFRRPHIPFGTPFAFRRSHALWHPIFFYGAISVFCRPNCL